jgi:hypothetical protein
VITCLIQCNDSIPPGGPLGGPRGGPPPGGPDNNNK